MLQRPSHNLTRKSQSSASLLIELRNFARLCIFFLSLPKHYNNSWRREVAVVAGQNIESLQQEVERIRDEREKLLKLLELGEVEERLKGLIVDHELKSTG